MPLEVQLELIGNYDTNRAAGYRFSVPSAAAQSIQSIFTHAYKDPAAYHFYTVFLGFDRAMDYLISRPDWDRKTLVVSGSSQGGWLALVMAG